MRKNLSSGAPWESLVGYSRAVQIGNIIEISGTTAVKNGSVQHKDDVVAQTQLVIEIISNSLQKLNASLTDVIRTRVYVKNIDHWELIAKVHQQYFGQIKPATTMVEVSRFVSDSILVEIEATAILTDKN